MQEARDPKSDAIQNREGVFVRARYAKFSHFFLCSALARANEIQPGIEGTRRSRALESRLRSLSRLYCVQWCEWIWSRRCWRAFLASAHARDSLEEGQKRRELLLRLLSYRECSRTGWSLSVLNSLLTQLFYSSHLKQVNAVTTENNLVTGVKPNQCFIKKRRLRRRSSWNLPASSANALACTKSSVARRLKSVGMRRPREVSTVNRHVA